MNFPFLIRFGTQPLSSYKEGQGVSSYKRRAVTYSILGIVMALAFSSCQKDKPVTVYMGYDYFPNTIGHWVVYNVDSIYINPLNPAGADTFKYYVEEVIDSFYTDNTGARTQVIVRYKSNNANGPWTYQKTWTGNLTTTEALRTEDGIKYVKLNFPVAAGANWNGGAFNSNPGTNAAFPDWDQSNFQYLSVNTPLTVNGHYFDSTLTVEQDSTLNFAIHQFFLEEYAPNVGRIYKQIINLSTASNLILPNSLGQDSLWVPSDYIYLIKRMELAQGSTIYTETYVASGN